MSQESEETVTQRPAISVQPSRWRRRLIAVLVGIVAITVTVYVMNRRSRQPDICPGLVPHGTECVGSLVGDATFLFGSSDDNINRVLRSIIAENVRVAVSGKPYVRIGLLMPMTAAEGSALSPTEIRNSLQGAFTAQVEANADQHTSLGDPTPWLQLVLANEATDQGGWPQAVQSLAALAGGPHPLVAVTGLGISVPATTQAAKRLGELGIPAIGSVLTADDMVADGWLFKVSPSNRQYAATLAAHLRSLPKPPTNGYLVWDRNPDNYVSTLRQALDGEFGTAFQLDLHNQGFNGSKPPHIGTPQLFTQIVSDICAVDPDIVFYSGRGRDLTSFLDALALRGKCQSKVRPILVATGATGLALSEEVIRKARVGILDAASTDNAAWQRGAPGTPEEYPSFARRFAALGFPAEDLNSGYAIQHRDGVAAAVWAVRRDVAAKGTDGATTAGDVRNMLFSSANATIPGAAGRFYFREQPATGLWPQGRRVPVIHLGAV